MIKPETAKLLDENAAALINSPMRCDGCLKKRDVLYRMNEKGEPGIFGCTVCGSSFWEIYMARKFRK